MRARIAIALCSLVATAHAENPESLSIKATLEQRFPTVKIESVAKAPWEGMYEVVTESGIAYTNKDAKFLFSGKVIDTVTKEDLTERRWNEHLRFDFASLPFNSAIKIVKGNGSRKLAVFEDPLCPYCAQLEKELQHIDDITLFVFLYPLENVHPGATELARKIWCAKDPAVAWQNWVFDRLQPETSQCESDVVAPLRMLAKSLKITSTPTVVFADGFRNPGYMTSAEIESALAKSTRR